MTGAAPLMVAEPPAAYLKRPPVVVDCSALAAILFDEASRDLAVERLAGKALFAPALLAHEIVSVALKKQQLGWNPDSISLALTDFGSYDIKLLPVDVVAQYDIAMRYKLSAYDAAYLALAANLKASLATFDTKLNAAARVHLANLGT